MSVRTEGNWIAGPYDSVWVGIRRDALTGKWVEAGDVEAKIIGSSNNPSNLMAFAAAADLLSVVKRCRIYIADLEVPDLLADLDAAIAKAEGA
jgi:hypothetical protein